MTTPPSHMVLAWYRPKDWSKWRELCPGKMHESFEAWRIQADRTLLQMVRQGITVHRSEIRPDEFKEWCRRELRAIDGQSRCEYASAKFAKLGAVLFRPYEPHTVPSRKQAYRDMREAVQSGFSLRELCEPYLRRSMGCICPLFRRGQDAKLEHYGSGILTSIGERQFLLTAAHVLDDALVNEVLIPSKNGFLSLEGEMATTCEDGAHRRKQDRLDVGFYLFSEKQANAIHDELVFLSERDLDPLDLTEAGDAYSIVGYPAFKSKGTETSLTVFDGAGLSDAYRDLLADERTHLIVRFRPDRAINYANASIGAKPSFSGVSGGGVFAWSKDLPNPNALSQPKLAGIVTEYSSRHSAFVCTRIGFLLSAMQRHFPDMQFGEVPYPRQIKSRDK